MRQVHEFERHPARPRRRSIRLALLAAGASVAFSAPIAPASAQNLPAPSRTVFKCEVDGKVTYSDAPCLGARKLEVEPTRGLNKMSGTVRTGADVRREQHREIVAEAIKPLTGKNAKELETHGRRMRLAPEARNECQRLDGEIAMMERKERQASGGPLMEAQQALLEVRLRYRELGC